MVTTFVASNLMTIVRPKLWISFNFQTILSKMSLFVNQVLFLGIQSKTRHISPWDLCCIDISLNANFSQCVAVLKDSLKAPPLPKINWPAQRYENGFLDPQKCSFEFKWKEDRDIRNFARRYSTEECDTQMNVRSFLPHLTQNFLSCLSL